MTEHSGNQSKRARQPCPIKDKNLNQTEGIQMESFANYSRQGSEGALELEQKTMDTEKKRSHNTRHGSGEGSNFSGNTPDYGTFNVRQNSGKVYDSRSVILSPQTDRKIQPANAQDVKPRTDTKLKEQQPYKREVRARKNKKTSCVPKSPSAEPEQHISRRESTFVQQILKERDGSTFLQ